MSATGRESRERGSTNLDPSAARRSRTPPSQLSHVGPQGSATVHWSCAFQRSPPATTMAASAVVNSSETGWKTWEREAHHASTPRRTGAMGRGLPWRNTPRERAAPATTTVTARRPNSTAGFSTAAGATSTRRGAAAQCSAQRAGAREAQPQGCGTS